MPASPAFIAIAITSLVFAYLSGVTDSANIVAPLISARALGRRRALLLTAAATAVAPFVFGVAVARAFGAGVLLPQGVSPAVVLAATLSALAWRWLTWRLSLPSSSSHALVGGLVGAGLASAGLGLVNLEGLLKVFLALFFSPAAGLLVGYGVTTVIYWLAQSATPRVNVFFRYGQVLTAAGLALSWGANDAQKTIGLLALGLAAVSGGTFSVPIWIILASTAAVVLGTLTSGSRLIRTLGGRFYRIRPVHGLAAQLGAAAVIFSAAAVGGPVSTTQVVSTTILGAGAAQRINMVRWGIATDILWAWVLTVPATMVLGAGLLWVFERLPF
jgi:PiT family inorganic phosphate transporter